MKKVISGLVATAILWSLFAPLAHVTRAQVMGKAKENRLLDTPGGLVFRLSEGTVGADSRRTQPPADTDPLSDAAVENILKRLPGIKHDPNEQTEFAKRIGSLPAPKNGQKIPVKFPADEQAVRPNVDLEKLPLEVIRFSPDGEVSLAPDLSITFSQPMVAVSSQEEAAQYAPVELTPQVEGRWRWLGTRTLMFDTTKRFPMATKFTARVPAGTKSANGQSLQKDFVWKFTTPPPKAVRMIPNGQTTGRDALVFIAFDQAIIPEAVLSMITVTGGGKRLPIRLATEGEISSNLGKAYVKDPEIVGRWLAFKAVNSDGLTENALPADSPINVTIARGTPSAEGPLTTSKSQGFSFRTYGALKLKGPSCSWDARRTTCFPTEDFRLQFTNPIVGTTITADSVKVEPKIENAKIYASGQYIFVQGIKKGNTSYTVTVDETVKDIYGQTLQHPVTATFRVGRAEPSFLTQGGRMVVLDPTSKPAFSVYTTNHNSFKLRLYRVEPQDWHAFQTYIRYLNYDDGKRPMLPGKLVSDEVVSIKNTPDEMVETRVDLAAALNGGFGSVIVDIEPTLKRDKYDRTRVLTWVQATQIGLDAFVDNTELVGFATELRTGRPLNGVELSIYPNDGKVIAERSTINDENVDEGFFAGIWNWLSGWGGRGGPSADSLNSNGSVLEMETIEPARSNQTGPNGILRLELSANSSTKGQNLLIAKRGNDTAFLPENTEYYWIDSGNWYRKEISDSLRWFVFDDRKMYKPKEEVAVKGYIRRYTGGKLGDIEALGNSVKSSNWSAKDARNNEIAKGVIEPNTFGAFDFKFALPDNANLGNGRIDFFTGNSTDSPDYTHQFQIQEFRRPEFEVIAKVDSEAPHFVGGQANLSVEAKYFAGGGLASADANWTVTASPTNYTPPNRDDFTFGTWVPWWRGYGYDGYYGGRTQNFKGVTDASGIHHLKIDFDSVKPPRPYTVSASASVQDVNRQTWSSTATLLVHPADLYVGIRTPRTFVQKGEKIEVESIVSDIDGKLIAGRDVEIKAVLKDWTVEAGVWKEVTLDEQFCTVKSTEKAQKCTFVAKQGGRYTVTSTVMDDRERYNESELTVWVPGGKTPPNRNVEQEEAQIIPGKKDFAPGDVAELLVIAPFTPAEGVLTLRRDGIVKTERFSMKDSSITLKILLEEKYLPNIYAQVDLVGSAPRLNDKGEVDPKLANRPAFASGNINLSISTESRKLTVTAEPRDKTLVPGGETKVDVEVRDNRGEPVANSEVAVVIVDESVLALSRYTIADPMAVFYSARSTGTTDYHLRKDVLLGNPNDVKAKLRGSQETVDVSSNSVRFSGVLKIAPAAKANRKDGAFSMDAVAAAESAVVIDGNEVTNFRSGQLGKDNEPQQGETPIAQRANFDALAVFAPTVKTDSNGRATVDVKLPDNLTRYRITAVSVDAGKRFGKSESNITAKQPLMVRPSAPRFLNFGDRAGVPVVVQNQTDEDMAVDVVMRATNASLGVSSSPRVSKGSNAADEEALTNGRATDTIGKRVLVKANSREEVRFPVSTVKAGTARFQIAVSSGKFSDAAEISLPVWTPATTEAFATYGTTDQNGAIIQPVQAPADVYSQFGGLEVTTSSTQLQELTDAFVYLSHYPYACSEQISSRMISTAALRDVLQAFKAKETPTGDELDAQFKRDIQILQSRQRDDGSFGLWKRDRERYEYPFLTVHVAHALALAKAKGYQVPDEMLNKTKPYLKDVEKHFNDEWYKSSPKVRWTISAYALYIRDLMGDKDAAKAKRLLAEATFEKIPFEALGWILSVLADDKNSTAEVEAIKHFLMNRTTETAAAANFVTDYGDGGWLIMYSNRRADGVLLEALIKADPNNDLIPKLVRGLLAHRKRGHWGSTQENVFILLALDKYFNAFEKVTPDFVTRIWLGDTYAGEQPFKGRSVDSNVLNIPMEYLSRHGGASNLLIDRQGAGRLYYRIGMKYAPKNLKLAPADYGFTVMRKYEAVDNPEDVRQNADGSWTIKSGARVRVRLTMIAQARRYHVALLDNLPAGLEILNPELAVTEVIPADTGGGTGVVEVGSRSLGRNYYWWRQNWFEHQNFRDERAEAFASLLWEGVYNYTYVARATTPGEFVVPPAKAEEMYQPETFGRTGTDFVRVE